MNAGGLSSFGGYQKALLLFDLAVEDMRELRDVPECRRLISQQIASVDSVCANMEEGYGRLSRAEFIRFLDFSRGSARESQGRYLRLRHWLPVKRAQAGADLAGEIIGSLTVTISRLRSTTSEANDSKSVRESPEIAEEWGFTAIPDIPIRHLAPDT